MQKTLLWEAFVGLDKNELRELDKFVRSPFFNKQQSLIGLFDYLRACVNEGRVPDTHTAYARCYPADTTYHDQRMRLANSDLLALMEHYLIYVEKFATPETGQILLAGQYRRRNLDKHARMALRTAKTALTKRPWRHAEYFEDYNACELEEYRLAAATKRYEAFNLQEISDLLDTGFAARKLRHACFMLSHQTVFKSDYRLGMLDAVLAAVETDQNLMAQPAISLYYHACRFLSVPDGEAHFAQFRTLLEQHSHVFPGDEIRALYLLAINFGVKKSNELGHAWLRATFDLYQTGLARELLLENGILSRFAYSNVVAIAIRLDEIDWADTFVQHYQSLLEKRYRRAAFSLNSARIAYLRRDYGKALTLLQDADYKDFINGMNAKTLQMKIYYETNETDLLESHLDSMQNYLRRQSPVGYHRDNYARIIRYARALVRLSDYDRPGALALQQRIEEETGPLTEKVWLLEQMKRITDSNHPL
jgi:hypothetical protein